MATKRTDIQKQLDQMKEQICYIYDVAQSALMLANTYEARISELEREHENAPNPFSLPDSNGFWRDDDGDVWAYDGDPDNPPLLIFSTTFQEVCETPTDDTANWELVEDYAPFTKISNPFTTGKNHADR